MAGIKTYNSRQVLISLGTHSVSGYAEDSFVTIEQKGDGVTSKTGCDGEVARAIDPNEQYVVKIAVQQQSATNKWLQTQYAKDKKDGTGLFPVLIKDLTGKVQFSATDAWVLKQPSRVWGKDTNNREWEIETGPAEYKEY